MSLLDITEPSGAERAARQIRLTLRDIIARAVDTVKQIHINVWLHDDVDPQDVLDVFGTNAGQYIASRDAAVAFITALAEANGQVIGDYLAATWYEPPAGKDLTINEDGTVTVIDV